MPETAVMDDMFFIFNLILASQAGRRGFESRLPLQSDFFSIAWEGVIFKPSVSIIR